MTEGSGEQEVPMKDSRIGVTVHASSCVDDEGKIECVCGLEDLQAEAERYWNTDGPAHDLEEQMRGSSHD